MKPLCYHVYYGYVQKWAKYYQELAKIMRKYNCKNLDIERKDRKLVLEFPPHDLKKLLDRLGTRVLAQGYSLCFSFVVNDHVLNEVRENMLQYFHILFSSLFSFNIVLHITQIMIKLQS